MVRRTTLHATTLCLAAAAVVLLPAPARAQYKTLGPQACVACHEHARQAQKWQKEEPAQLKGRAHFNTRKQLDAPKSAAFAKAIGLADPYSLKGSCVQCHATVFKGDANAGVSCESCHGPASAYNEPHQVKGAYQKAVTLGLADLRGKPAAIAKVCVDCHVTPDKRLAAAGHPVGEKFDAGVSLRKIVHWAAAYDFAAVSATGRKLAAARAAGAGGRAAAPAPGPGPAPSGPKPVPGGAPAVTRPPAEAPAGAPPAAPAGPANPWDWDQPVQALPADYDPNAPAAAPAETPEPAAAQAPRRRKPRAERTLAYEAPIPPAEPGAVDAGPLSPPVEPVDAPAAPVTPPVAGDARSRALALLERALRAGTRAPDLPPAQRPQEFEGPDGELLRLQDEAMALGLEALRKSP